MLFNKSLRVGHVPDELKLANVVPIHKKEEVTYVENYRPISLLSFISIKYLNVAILTTLNIIFTNRQSLSYNGFILGKSCITQLVEVLEHISRELDRSKQINVLYLDMSKVFDKVSHNQLLHRLRAFGFEGSILKWFASYSTILYQQTTVLGATS